MSDTHEQSDASIDSIAAQLTDEQTKFVQQHVKNVRWLADMPADLFLEASLTLMFLGSRDATSAETAVSEEEMDRFDDYVSETLRRLRCLKMLVTHKGTADFSGEQPTFFEFTPDTND